MDYPLESHLIQTNGVQLHVVQSGPAEGPVVFLLHGFPEFWYGWRKQISFLASKGFRVWAPDLRGYNHSDKPKGIQAYRLDLLMADIIGLIDGTMTKKVILCGHDWGAVLCWSVASCHPEKVDKVVIMNVPPISVMQRHLTRNPIQMLKSSYILFFQIPWLPEAAARFRDWTLLTRVMTSSSRPGTFTDQDFHMYRKAWSQPDAFHSMLNWYRALLRTKKQAAKRIKIPLLLLWGEQDAFLTARMAEESIQLCEKGKLVYFENATHWLHHEEPDQVNEEILQFLLS